MFWLMPHLHAAQRRISAVVPVKSPLTRRPMYLFAFGSPVKKCGLIFWPVTRLNGRFTPLFSRSGLVRTHVAHRAPDGSLAPGGKVRKKAGAEVTPAGPEVTPAGPEVARAAASEPPTAVADRTATAAIATVRTSEVPIRRERFIPGA